MNNWSDTLIIQYEEGRKALQRKHSKLTDSYVDTSDKTQINSMVSSMTFSIDWMKRGRRPGNMRGIDKRSAYQKRALVDVDLIPSLEIQPKEKELSDDEKRVIYDLLIDLSNRERQCYLLYFAQGLSMQQIADELDIKKPSVQKFIDRAKKKINQKKLCHTSVI
ncbi:sigma-70 family RNA polymerase sigma factor [Aquibacillus rhizosphaerae]|uniref:Sigma-70 family RNA polymerase sigma factor n=1 Tax=Aquibacillus rhizosphaerae TaxID=3051431 RepID=A0ABT7LAB4_9BACI|nr:sigma-70 family RNA polymerase sigma factor [Aquibacillus sp. LR5S19]MDL4842821.1 sigma-70 family RNA polymerase sigma factor [Aquibacillus sp. LR5S19]